MMDSYTAYIFCHRHLSPWVHQNLTSLRKLFQVSSNDVSTCLQSRECTQTDGINLPFEIPHIHQNVVNPPPLQKSESTLQWNLELHEIMERWPDQRVKFLWGKLICLAIWNLALCMATIDMVHAWPTTVFGCFYIQLLVLDTIITVTQCQLSPPEVYLSYIIIDCRDMSVYSFDVSHCT